MSYTFLLTYAGYIGLIFVFWSFGFGDWYTGTLTGINETQPNTTQFMFNKSSEASVSTDWLGFLNNAWLFMSFLTFGFANPFTGLFWFAWLNISLSLVALYLLLKDIIIPIFHAIGNYIPFT